MTITSDAVASTFNGAFGLIDDLYTSDEERAEAKLKLVAVAESGRLAQMEVNAVEAASRSLFVAGWRPAVGWTCVSAFALTFVVLPVVQSAAIYYTAYTGENLDLSALPELSMSEMMPVLLGMLGLGGLRTYEKRNGVTT
jgi:hypothetical protein